MLSKPIFHDDGLKLSLRIVILALIVSCGLTCIILACTLPQPSAWWPLLAVIFIIFAPIPTAVTSRLSESTQSRNCICFGIFLTMAFIVSSFALPVVFARAPLHKPMINPLALVLTEAGNVVVYVGYIVFFLSLLKL